MDERFSIFLLIVQIILIILKLNGDITWSWISVLALTWVPIAIVITILFVLATVMGIVCMITIFKHLRN